MPVKVEEIQFAADNRAIDPIFVDKLVDNFREVGVDVVGNPIIATCKTADWDAVVAGNHTPLTIRVSISSQEEFVQGVGKWVKFQNPDGSIGILGFFQNFKNFKNFEISMDP